MFQDIIPARYRRYVYALMVLLSLAYGAWQAADGDWRQALGGLVVAIVNAMANGNTNVPPVDDGKHAA